MHLFSWNRVANEPSWALLCLNSARLLNRKLELKIDCKRAEQLMRRARYIYKWASYKQVEPTFWRRAELWSEKHDSFTERAQNTVFSLKKQDRPIALYTLAFPRCPLVTAGHHRLFLPLTTRSHLPNFPSSISPIRSFILVSPNCWNLGHLGLVGSQLGSHIWAWPGDSLNRVHLISTIRWRSTTQTLSPSEIRICTHLDASLFNSYINTKLET